MATRVLVINDTQEILEMFRMILEEEGCQEPIPLKGMGLWSETLPEVA